MALTKYLGKSLMRRNDDLNSQIGVVETAKQEMTSKFRKGLVKFSKTAPEIVACQGDITEDMKHSVDKMYQYFKRADVIATDCNNHMSTALEISEVLIKKIKEKQEEIKHDIRKHEREKDCAKNEKKRSKDRVRAAEKRVETAKEDLKKAKSNFKKGAVTMGGLTAGNTAIYSAIGGMLGGPLGALVGGALAGGVSLGGTAVVLEELEEDEDEAKRDLSSKKSELKKKETELKKIRNEIADCENELESINECLDQVEDLDRKVRRGRVQVANLSAHIRNCLTVIRTTVGKSKMLRDECLSEIVTFNALVKIVNDLAHHFKRKNLLDFLSVTQNDSMTKAIRDVERTSCGSAPRAKRARVKAPTDDFMDA